MSWQPISPLSDDDREIYVGDADALRETFDAARADAEAHHVEVSALLDRLKREWAIETGILERLYDIDRGTTNLLIERGFVADLMVRRPGARSPNEIRAMLNDHHDGIEIVYHWVSGKRPLSLFEIRSLHQVLTRNQETVEGVDPEGRIIHIPLRSGQWKLQPNSPTKADGTLHEYCSPEQTQSEMERVLSLFGEYEDVHPLVLAAWLHHRFTQIHPFQDGNGRVARCLMNFVLVRGGFLPAVIGRDDRVRYLDALQEADGGHLEPLVRVLADVMTSRMVRLLGEVLELRQKTGHPLPNKPLTAVGAAERIAQRLRARADSAANEPETEALWRRAVVSELAAAIQHTVDATNEEFVRAGFKPRVSIQIFEESWFLAMHPDPIGLLVTPGPILGGNGLMVVVGALLRREQPPKRDPSAELHLASAEPISEVVRRIKEFVDHRVGAWLGSLD